MKIFIDIVKKYQLKIIWVFLNKIWIIFKQIWLIVNTIVICRQKKLMRIGSPSSWSESTGTPYRSSNAESHFGNSESHYTSPHYSGRPRGRGLRSRPPYLR